MRPTARAVLLSTLVGLPLLAAVLLMTSRVGVEARFVTWPVVGFTAVAAIVAVLGVWSGSAQPSLLAAGLLPAMVVSYFLPAAPFPFVAAVLVGMGILAVTAGGVATGVAAGTGALMVVFVVLQGPAVECSESGVSGGSGPWWIAQPSRSSSSGSGTAGGAVFTGAIQVGEHHYAYTCEGGHLTTFERLDGDGAPGLDVPRPVNPLDG